MKGLGVSQGVGIGKVFKLEADEILIERKEIENAPLEVDKLKEAILECKKQINKIYQIAIKNIGEKEAKIFKAHEMILEDDTVFDEVINIINIEKVNAEFALSVILNKYIKLFENIEDEFLRDRANDIKDIMNRLTRILLGIKCKRITDIEDNTVIVSYDLTPSDTAQMDKDKVAGIIVETGGRTSHAAIIARTLEIPTVVGVEGVFDKVTDGDEIICDGITGKININPSSKIMNYYQKKKEKEEEIRNNLNKQVGLETVTLDGFKVKLEANIGVPTDIKYALKNDAEAIGLFRSEFLYMSRTRLPSEEEQFEAYKEILIKMGDKPVVIRTLDVGGDKEIPYLKIPKEMNPFLGYRAIRLCLDNTDIFKAQLRAILRASVYGRVKILFPMISSVNELRGAKKLYFETRDELIQEGIEVNTNIELGIMIEIPSAAIISDVLAKEVDFFSIGTNDLIQYTLAVDRMNSKINHLYNQYHPALIRLVKTVIDNAHANNIKVAMCGEMAGEANLIPLLIGMGLDEFSMSPSLILNARHIIRSLNKKECEALLNEVLNLDAGIEVEKYLISKFIKE